MKRREFLSASAKSMAIATLATGVSGVNMRALASSPISQSLQSLVGDSDRVLVLIQLAGGNDGLNTVIPVDDPVYYNSRKNIAIPKSQTLALRDGLAFHPALTGFRDLFKDGRLSVVQNVTYPNPDRSHFRGTDIWLTATDADVFKSTGWIGRYLQTLAPNFPAQMPAEPLAIQIGESLSLGFKADKGSLGITFRDPDAFYSLVDQNVNSNYDEAPATIGGAELDFVRSVEKASQVYSKIVKTAADKVKKNAVTYPNSNPLARSLQIVSRLIAGGLGTKIYLVNIAGGSFDTHYNQGAASGPHATLLNYVGEAVKLFLDDCEQLGTANRVAGMTFSEFGRRVAENGSQGTDHGTAAPLFVFGKQVIGGQILGHNPDLVNLDPRGDLLMEYDYRQIYAAALMQWFGNKSNDASQILFRDFSPLSLFQTLSSVNDPDTLALQSSLQVMPQPCDDKASIAFNLPQSAEVQISIHDMRGAEVGRGTSARFQAGLQSIIVPCDHLTVGTYFVRLRAGRVECMTALHVAR